MALGFGFDFYSVEAKIYVDSMLGWVGLGGFGFVGFGNCVSTVGFWLGQILGAGGFLGSFGGLIRDLGFEKSTKFEGI